MQQRWQCEEEEGDTKVTREKAEVGGSQGPCRPLGPTWACTEPGYARDTSGKAAPQLPPGN